MDEFLSEIYIEVFKQWILMQSNKNLAISLSDDYKTILLFKISHNFAYIYKICSANIIMS